MKAVPILVITNMLALGLAVAALMDSGDTPSSSSRSSRASSERSGAQGNDYYDAQIADLKAEIARISSDRATVKATPAGESSKLSEDGKEIDRSYGEGELDADAVKADPAFADFRARVRLAGEANEREDSINREVERMDELISDNKIGTLDKAQKTRVAEQLIDHRSKTRMVWRGLMNREDLRSLPQDERRNAYREASRKEQETIKAESMKVLEGIMPAADAQTLMESGRGGMGGRSMRRGR
jgi:hypothetical protein